MPDIGECIDGPKWRSPRSHQKTLSTLTPLNSTILNNRDEAVGSTFNFHGQLNITTLVYSMLGLFVVDQVKPRRVYPHTDRRETQQVISLSLTQFTILQMSIFQSPKVKPWITGSYDQHLHQIPTFFEELLLILFPVLIIRTNINKTRTVVGKSP